MRIAMMGSGGIGGYFGGRMAVAGADVTFIARGRHLGKAGRAQAGGRPPGPRFRHRPEGNGHAPARPFGIAGHGGVTTVAAGFHDASISQRMASGQPLHARDGTLTSSRRRLI